MKRRATEVFFSFLRLIVFVLCNLVLATPISSQNISESKWREIESSDSYLIGMGISDNLDNARQGAIGDLISKISLKVESQFNYITSEETKDDKLQSNEKVNMILNSYSAVSLNNVCEYLVEKNGEYIVYRYLKKSDMYAMFKRRVNMAKKWAMDADEREKSYKIGDALQNYYWALALLRSCPDGDLETLASSGGNENMIMTVFKNVKDILGGMTIRAVGVERDELAQRVMLEFDYKGHPVTNFNYKFYNGENYSEVYTAKDGRGELLISPNFKLNRLKILAEYECREEANIHPELKSVMATTDPVPFKAAEFKIDTKYCNNIERGGNLPEMRVRDLAKEGVADSSMSANGNLKDKCSQVVDIVEKSLITKRYGDLAGVFTAEGKEMFDKLIGYGSAKLLKTQSVELYPDKDGMVCRSLPMSFTFKGNRRTFTEDVVFYFNSEGKIREVAFALDKAAVDDIMNRGEWDLGARQVMVHFLETYKTAYALKRLDYISSIFSNDALIITGSVVKSAGVSGVNPSSKKHVKYVRQTKEEYIKNLRKCFNSNEYINIRFADNIVRKSHTKDNIYGIQIKQDYFSSSYGDTGYLFLLIDFADPDAPIIHVRTWQPDKDPNVKDGRIGMADFML